MKLKKLKEKIKIAPKKEKKEKKIKKGKLFANLTIDKK